MSKQCFDTEEQKQFYEDTIAYVNMIDSNMMFEGSECIYEKIYKEKYGKYDKIRIHTFYAPSIGETARSLSIAWYNGLTENETSEKNEHDNILDVLMPYWVGSGIEKDVKGYANCALMRCMTYVYEVIDYSNAGLWRYIFYNHADKIEVIKKIPDISRRGSCKDFIIFHKSEEEKICGIMKKINLKKEQSFVILAIRDSAYYSQTFKDYDNSYADFRNSDINMLDDAVLYLNKSGILSIRTGKKVKHRYNNPMCIDYAADFHDDLFDLYLIKNCKFAVGTCSGLINLGQVIGKPCVIINLIVMLGTTGFSYSENDLFIPKTIIDGSARRLTFTEMWECELMAPKFNKNGRIGEPFYSNAGLKIVDNSAQEIMEIVTEMNERLDGVWIETEEDKQLQQRYHMLRQKWIEKHPSCEKRFYHANCGAIFLRNHKDMLGLPL